MCFAGNIHPLPVPRGLQISAGEPYAHLVTRDNTTGSGGYRNCRSGLGICPSKGRLSLDLAVLRQISIEIATRAKAQSDIQTAALEVLARVHAKTGVRIAATQFEAGRAERSHVGR